MKKWLIVVAFLLFIVLLAGLGYAKQYTPARAKSDLEIRYYPQTFNIVEKLKSDDYYVLFKAQLVADPNVVFNVGVRKTGKKLPWHVQTTDNFVEVVKKELLDKVLQDKVFVLENQSDIEGVSQQVYQTMQELNAWLDVYCIKTDRFSSSCKLPIIINGNKENVDFLVMSKEEIKKAVTRAYNASKKEEDVYG